MSLKIKLLFMLLAILLSAFFLGLGNRPVSKIQEVRVAETAREMIVSGDWAIPRYNGELRLQKPPLPYWLTATSYQMLGVNEFATRVPAAIFGLACGLLVFLWCVPLAGMKIAANSVLVLTTSLISLRYFRSGEADAPLLFFIIASCFLGWHVLRQPASFLLRALFGLTLGLGFLTKGPAGIAIPLVTMLAVVTLERHPKDLGRLFNLAGLILLIFTAFGWYAWIAWHLPDAAGHFFGKQVDETFISGNHAKAPWWYIAHALEFFAPWGFLLIPAAYWSYRQARSSSLPDYLRFSWVWLAVVFALLTITVNKQTQYALLLAPPLAIILGHYLDAAENRFSKLNGVLFAIFCVIVLVGLGTVLYRTLAEVATIFTWLSILSLPPLFTYALKIKALSIPVLIVSMITVTGYLYKERYYEDMTEPTIQALMIEANNHSPIYQAKPGDGAVSFYAGKVIPPASRLELSEALERQSEVWLISESQPEIDGIKAQTIAGDAIFKLYLLTKSAVR